MMTDLQTRVENGVGRITLTRPQSLNALTWPMIKHIHQTLIEWAEDTDVSCVMIDAIGEKAFCAGGDIQMLYEQGCAGNFAYGREFWLDEYRLNAYIARFPKPYVAMMDGIVMGGGVGVSAHGSHRIVTERSMVAMPECSIGLIPDAGGSRILGHAPGQLGVFAGMSGYRMQAADAILMGFADYFVPVEALPALKQAMVDAQGVEPLSRFCAEPPESTLKKLQAVIDPIFSAHSVDEIVEQLNAQLQNGTQDSAQNQPQEWAKNALKSIQKGSPLSVACARASIERARQMSIEEALQQEYRFIWRCMEQGEFLEGIRAAVIDKDRNPQWNSQGNSQGEQQQISSGMVEGMLASLKENELTFH